MNKNRVFELIQLISREKFRLKDEWKTLYVGLVIFLSYLLAFKKVDGNILIFWLNSICAVFFCHPDMLVLPSCRLLVSRQTWFIPIHLFKPDQLNARWAIAQANDSDWARIRTHLRVHVLILLLFQFQHATSVKFCLFSIKYFKYLSRYRH